MNEQLLNVVLEEYKALRAQVVTMVDRQYSLTYWSISGVAILVAALTASWDRLQRSPNAVLAIIVVAIPAIGTMYAVAWAHIISQIAAIGWYLYHVEEKVARLFWAKEIRDAYDLASDAPIEPFQYLIGWEHRLWRENSSTLIKRPIRLVKFALAAGYVAVMVLGLRIGAQLHGVAPARQALNPALIATAAAWVLIWFAVSAYLGKMSAVGTRARLGPRQRSHISEAG